MSNIKEMLKSSIEQLFSVDDHHFESSIELLEEDLVTKGYKVECDIVNEGDWISNGKNEHMDNALIKIIVDDEEFILGVRQSCSKEYDPVFYKAEIKFLKTEKEYNKPKIVTDFIYEGKKVVIKTDKSAEIDGVSFMTVEEAIKSI